MPQKTVSDQARTMKTTSMRDVASLANVSVATVSRVLNGSTSVRHDYRQRVLAAIADTDYRPNRLARNLRRQAADMIGVVVSDIENPHFSEAVRVIEDAAYTAGYRVMLCNTDETPDKQRVYLQMLADERASAVILSPADFAGSGIESLIELDIPVVCFDRVIDRPTDTVVSDGVEGLRRATEHLIWLGHERIAYLGGRLGVETGVQRLAGYSEAMRSAGLIPFALDGAFRTDVAEKETEVMLATTPRPTALIVGNNQMTLGALRAIRRANLSIPDDIALVAVDDPPWAELVEPPLTTLAQPIRQMAEGAMELVRRRLKYPGREITKVVLPFELRIRASCGLRRAGSNQGST